MSMPSDPSSYHSSMPSNPSSYHSPMPSYPSTLNSARRSLEGHIENQDYYKNYPDARRLGRVRGAEGLVPVSSAPAYMYDMRNPIDDLYDIGRGGVEPRAGTFGGRKADFNPDFDARPLPGSAPMSIGPDPFAGAGLDERVVSVGGAGYEFDDANAIAALVENYSGIQTHEQAAGIDWQNIPFRLRADVLSGVIKNAPALHLTDDEINTLSVENGIALSADPDDPLHRFVVKNGHLVFAPFTLKGGKRVREGGQEMKVTYLEKGEKSIRSKILNAKKRQCRDAAGNLNFLNPGSYHYLTSQNQASIDLLYRFFQIIHNASYSAQLELLRAGRGRVNAVIRKARKQEAKLTGAAGQTAARLLAKQVRGYEKAKSNVSRATGKKGQQVKV